MGSEEFWKIFAQVLGYGATAAICLYLVLVFILKWKALDRDKTDANNGTGNGKAGDKNPGWWTTEISRIVLAVVSPLLTNLNQRLEEELHQHHEYVRGRHEQMALSLAQITQIQAQQIETLKELTAAVRTIVAQQARFFDAIATLERFGKLLIPRREGDIDMR